MGGFIHNEALPSGTVVADIEFRRVIGAGGFGITYYGWDQGLDRAVAIKEYMPSDMAYRSDGMSIQPRTERDTGNFEWGLERFLDEARLLARFDHPNIVTVYRFFKAHGTAYIVMEYLEGDTLAEKIDKVDYDHQQVESWLLPVIDGLKCLHDTGFLHRDIKPGNIIIRPSGVPVLIDFGAARQAIGAKSKSITAIVTPGYAPIEQYSTKGHHGPWTDIYALGAIVYKIITGERPVEATDRMRRDPHKFLMSKASSVVKGYPEAFLKAIDSALAPDPEDRPQTLEQWRKSLTSKNKPNVVKVKIDPVKSDAGVGSNSLNDRQELGFQIGDLFSTTLGRGLVGLVILTAAMFAFLHITTFSEGAQYQKAINDNSFHVKEKFLEKFPNSEYANEVKTSLADRYFEAGKRWFDRKSYAGAYRFLNNAKNLDHPEAPYFLGNFYNTGLGEKSKDLEKAVELYELAADRGSGLGYSTLGAFYDRGLGGKKQDYGKALRLFQKATESDTLLAVSRGNYGIGIYYFYGRGGLEQDIQMSLSYLEKAITPDFGGAEYMIGFIYENGFLDGEKDLKTAKSYYEIAAKKKSKEAITALERLK